MQTPPPGHPGLLWASFSHATALKLLSNDRSWTQHPHQWNPPTLLDPGPTVIVVICADSNLSGTLQCVLVGPRTRQLIGPVWDPVPVHSATNVSAHSNGCNPNSVTVNSHPAASERLGQPIQTSPAWRHPVLGGPESSTPTLERGMSNKSVANCVVAVTTCTACRGGGRPGSPEGMESSRRSGNLHHPGELEFPRRPSPPASSQPHKSGMM